jgi:uncharacterized protein (DUF924 family)
MDIGQDEIIRFWFEEITPRQWWARNADFDRIVAMRFGALHGAATRCELYTWREKPVGRLAEVIVLDQFSRNIYRDDPRSYAFDSIALCLAQEAIRAGADQALPAAQRAFLYMPFMHSESAPIHARALELFAAPGLEASLVSERKHMTIIDRFGRYPHRNPILGRISTPDEIAFLARNETSSS